MCCIFMFSDTLWWKKNNKIKQNKTKQNKTKQCTQYCNTHINIVI